MSITRLNYFRRYSSTDRGQRKFDGKLCQHQHHNRKRRVLRFDLRPQRLYGGRVRWKSDDVSVGQQKELGLGRRDQLADCLFGRRHDETEALR